MPMWPKWSAAIGTSSPTTERTSATYSQIRSIPFGVRRTWVKGCISWVMLNSSSTLSSESPGSMPCGQLSAPSTPISGWTPTSIFSIVKPCSMRS